LEGGILNDLSIGKYDVVVTVGPSFTTQRTEARQSMSEFIQYYPAAAPLIGDLYAKSMDWPGADDMAERLEYMLPPEIKQKKAEERAKTNGQPPPAPPQQQGPPPDPTIELKMQELSIQLQQEQVKLQELQIKLEQEKERLAGIHLDNQIKLAESRKEPPDESGEDEGG
jgi:hypothetical protein